MVEEQGFETAVFGAPVWKLSIPADGLGLRDADDALRAARAAGVALIACRLPAGSADASPLGAAGFRRVEHLLTFRRPVPNGEDMPPDIGLAGAEIAGEIGRIAGAVFRHDRYHADPHVEDRVADAVKTRWAENNARGRADAVLVARAGKKVVGFNCLVRRGTDAVIDLIAVDATAQSRGFGARLVRAALAHYGGRARVMSVGTQATNAASIALYERMGFGLHAVQETWHWTP